VFGELLEPAGSADCYLGLLLPAPAAGRRDAIAGTPDHHTALAQIVEALLRERRTVNPLIVPARCNFLYSSSRPACGWPPVAAVLGRHIRRSGLTHARHRRSITPPI
jgi:hypothetical protein